MYGASTNYPAPWQSTLPLSQYGRQGYDTFPTSVIVIRSRPDYTYGNEPSRETLRRQLDEFKRLTETVLEQKKRISRERNRLHIRSARMFAPPPLVESMFDKPTFVKRACGGRWRVMKP
jgi:hypothetical protein